MSTYLRGLQEPGLVRAGDLKTGSNSSGAVLAVVGGTVLVFGFLAIRNRAKSRVPKPYKPDIYDPLYEYRDHF